MKTRQIKNLTLSADRRMFLDVKRHMTLDDVLRMMKRQQGDRSQYALAKELGVSNQFLTDIFKGRRAPGEKLLSALGLTQRTIYEKSA